LRLLLLSFALGALTSGHAVASSLVHIAPPAAGDTPSIASFGALSSSFVAVAPPPLEAAAVPLIAISPSIIAFGTPEPPVTLEKVASIGSTAPRPPAPTLMVIRGGIVGDGFTRAVVPTAQAAEAPAPQQPARRRADRGPSRKAPAAPPAEVAPPPTGPTSAPR
jgi:hypothetical protein